MKQKTLDGLDASYQCHKCSKTFETMSEIVKHSKRVHKPKQEILIHQNFVLENYKMVSTKTTVIKN